MKSQDRIYVVGYPKSGVTWLSRLLANILECPAGFEDYQDDNLEISSDLNEHFIRTGLESNFKVLKAHARPAVLEKRMNGDIRRVVYIKRDFRDIVVSGFFYNFLEKGEYSISEDDYKKEKLIDVFKRGPKHWLLYYQHRKQLIEHTKEISRMWRMNPTLGSWGEHIDEWKQFQKEKDIKISFVSYDELLDDTYRTLKRVLKYLEIDNFSDDKINQVINRQSFENKKKLFDEIDESRKIPGGKEFNYHFLRKGVSGDWRRFFSSHMARIVKNHQGDALIYNGFESNDDWCNNILNKEC